MPSIPFFVPAPVEFDEVRLRGLKDAVSRSSGLELAPLRILFAPLLPQIMERVPEAVAWAPASTAFVLRRSQRATPIVSIRRLDAPARSSVLLARPGIQGLPDLAERRVGWVSKLSLTGYWLPRLYLDSLGMDVATLFTEEYFCGSQETAVDALDSGDVDAIAVSSRWLPAAWARTGAQILASVGPIPSDVLVAGTALPETVRERLARTLQGLSLGPLSFAPVDDGHLDLFEQLQHSVSSPAAQEHPGAPRRAAVDDPARGVQPGPC
jgi:hypothetical protein